MKGSGSLRSPALVLLLLRPLLATGDFASRSQTRAMNRGGGARGSPEDSHRLQRTTVPGSDPQRSNEVLLLTPGEGDSPEQRHHVLYFPGDVQVTRSRPPRHAHAGSHTREGAGAPQFLPEPRRGSGLGGPRSTESGCQSRCLWVKGEAGQGRALTSPARSQRTLCARHTLFRKR